MINFENICNNSKIRLQFNPSYYNLIICEIFKVSR